MSTASQQVLRRISASPRLSGHRFQSPVSARRHIFFSLMDELTRGRDAAIKLHLLFEFSMIEKLVRAAGKKDVSACGRWETEIHAARAARRTATGLQGQELDALLLPALALMEFRQGRHEPATAHLAGSIVALRGYFERGLDAAGAAVLEQTLNILRASATRVAPAAFARSGAEFLELVIARAPRGESRPLLGDLADREVLLAYYLDESLFKIVDSLRADALAGFFAEIARAPWLRDAGPALQSAVRVIAGGARAAAACDDALVSGFAALPFSLAALTAHALGWQRGTDTPALDDALAAHPGLPRFAASIERSGLFAAHAHSGPELALACAA